MSKQTEALKLALEALDHNSLFTSVIPGYDGRIIEKAYKAINKALAAQPAQQRTEELLEIFKDVDQCGPLLGMGQPAQRTWVGLTDADIKAILDNDFGGSRADCMRAAEAKLKEKNT